MHKLLLGAAVALLHITPVVVLVKREDAVQRILPAATAFTAREIHLSAADAHRLHETLDWGPEEGVITFYTGTQGTRRVGALTFLRVSSQHGPLEVAVGFDAAGDVTRVEVTKATVETRPWVLEAVRSGLLSDYAGRKTVAQPSVISPASYRGKVGRMAAYMLEQIDKGVMRAGVVYGMFYK